MKWTNSIKAMVVAAPWLVAAFAAAQGQNTMTYADSVLSAGQLASAESLFYLQVRAHPRDPVARLALGRFLGERGARRVGVVLLEEARLFGGDLHLVADELAPLYRSLDDYRALVTLPASSLTMGERAQAAWLVTHIPLVEMADSAVVGYSPPADTLTLGRVRIRLGSERIDAVIDAHQHGLTLDADRMHGRGLKLFRVDTGDATVAVALEVHLGNVVLRNVPTVLEHVHDRQHAVIGLDELARLAPTFDTRRGRIVLRHSGEIPGDVHGERFATLAGPFGVRVLRRGHFLDLASPEIARLLRGRRWSLDPKRGELVLSR